MAARKRNIQNSGEKSKENGSKGTKPIPTKSEEEDPSTGGAYVLLVALLLLLAALTMYIYLFIDLRPALAELGLESTIYGEPPATSSSGKASDIPETGKRTINEKGTKKKSAYKKADITNTADNKIRQELDNAESLLDKGKFAEALAKFDALLSKYPKSPRATYGRALALDKKAESERSNKVLEQSIDQMLKVLDLPDVPKPLLIEAGKKCADRQTFRGWGFQATKTIQRLIDVYPEDIDLWNTLGVKYLLIHRNEDARAAFKQSLQMDPDNGFAKVHYGFIVKSIDHQYEDAIPYLREGIDSNASGVIDGRFFFHLGDALHRTGKPAEALDVYQRGADLGLFMSKWQRSLYNIETLAHRPWWTHEQSGQKAFLKDLEANWETIRDEGLAQLDPKTGSFVLEEEDLRESGDWKQFTLFVQGKKNPKNCAKAPKTCAIVEKYPDVAGCRRGQVKFSVMHPGVHVWPHCGPTNCRLRSHLGLVIPEGVRIRVVDETRGWQEGRAFVFDDSFEHEVWHDGDSFRLVLISDMWHPEVTQRQKQTLPAI